MLKVWINLAYKDYISILIMVRLSDVLLEQVTAQEFARLNEFWYGKPLDGDFNPVRILRPLTFGSYRTLVLEFLDFQYSDKICVYNNKWAHYVPNCIEIFRAE